MKTFSRSRTRCLLHLVVLVFALGIFAAPAARAGLTMDLNLFRFTANGTNYYYSITGGLSTNSTPSNPPFGDYFLASPNYPNSPYSSANYHYDSTNGFSWQGNGYNFYGNFDSVMQAATNGLWTLIVTGLNSTFTNTYQFRVTAHGLASNSLPAVVVTYPLDGTTNVSQHPVFTWQGPAGFNYVNLQLKNWDGIFNINSNLPAGQTSWQPPGTLPYSSFSFTPNYNTNGTSFLVAAAPTNGTGQAISSWTSTCEMNSSFTVGFTVPSPFTPPPGGHVLVARYTWDGTNTDPQAASIDVTGNGSNLGFGGGGGAQGGVTLTSNAIEGNRAVQFHNGDGGSLGWLGVTNPAPVMWALQGSFSVSCWIKTTQTYGNDNSPAYNGAGIVAADVNGQANDVVPMALTGSKIGFNTGGNSDDTLNSSNSINDGNYHHVVVTRDQASGVKTIYIDGVLDATDFGTTNTLDTPLKLTLGALSDAGNINPNDLNYYNGFDGIIDDLQIYSGVLNTAEVTYLFNNPGTTAPSLPLNGLVAHYAFDNSNFIGADTSGNGYDLDFNGNPNGNGVTSSGNTAAGAGAAYFDGGSFLSYSAIPTNVLAALAGDLTISVWVETTFTSGNDGDPAYFDAGIVAADVPSQANDIIPIALTGGGIGFNTGGAYDDTLSSSEDITNGNYHQVVITRTQATGEKKIYIDGLLNSTDTGTTNLLNDPKIMAVGAAIDASQSNPNNANTGPYYQGLLDDIQIYSRVLNAGEVAGLYNNPGSVATLNLNFNHALNTTNLNWSTSSDADWFVETTNTFNGVSAAQSGPVVNNQASTLTLTVTGPGTISFYWQTSPNGNNFNLGFNIDGSNIGNLFSGNSWVQAGPYNIGSGQHVLTWVAAANGDTDPTEAGYLDVVNFTPAPLPVITVNPASQTNYPGFPVGLAAGASSTTPVSWQWFEVGSGLIANATNAFYSPTNSGTSGVVGNYYAVASNQAGSAITLTAAVTFVSGPVPPNWSRVFRSPFYSANNSAIRDYNGGCAVDPAGDVYVANQYIGSVNIENSQAAIVKTLTAVGANGGAALIKYADTNVPPNASPLVWAVGLTNNDPASYSYADCVALAPGNGAYLASILIGTNWLGTNKFSNNGGLSVLLSRFDVNGSNVWSRLIGQTNLVFVAGYCDLVSDASGNVTVAGIMSGTADFGGIVLTATGFMGYMAQYNSNGVVRWAQVFPGSPSSMASDGRQIYITISALSSGGATNLSLGALSTPTDRAFGIGAVNAATGQALWLNGCSEQFGANGVNDAPLVSVSGSDIFLTGTANGSTAVFSNLAVSLPAGRGQYFARYDTNGNPQVATTFGGPTTMPWALAANASGVYISGDFDVYSDFGNYFVAAPEYVPSYLGTNYFTQPFVAKFDRNGNPLWARYGVSPVLANFRGIATTSNGVWASGFLDVTTDPFNNIIPALFGTNSIISDSILVGSPIGSFVFSRGGFMAKITEGTVAASPVQLLNPLYSGGNFQFAFLSQSGFTNTVQYRTNLATGTWQTWTNIPGDGTSKTSSIPLSIFNPSKQGFIRVSTQ